MRCKFCGGRLSGRQKIWCNKRCRDRWAFKVRDQRFVCPTCERIVLISAQALRRQKFCTRSCARAAYNRAFFRGARNGRWRGGKVLSYGVRWKLLKEELRSRDQVCQRCGKTPEQNGRALDVHHLNPYRFSADNSLDNLVALCRSCHMRSEDYGRRGNARFAGPVQLTLRPLSQRALRRLRGDARRARRRVLEARAEELRVEGQSLRQIARVLGVSHQTVANWLSAAAQGAL
jgi:5-methylcytosine-specific restriction endonuclease McrA